MGDVAEEDTYPRVLHDLTGMEVETLSVPWLTAKDARSQIKKITDCNASFFILNVGMAESLPHIYPIWIRKMINKFPILPVRRRLNNLESQLIILTNRRKPWISRDDYGRCVKKTIERAQQKFQNPRVILINTCHSGDFVERKRPGTNNNIEVLNDELKKVAEETGAEYLDIDSVSDDSKFIYDRVHFNAQGHRQTAEVLRQIMENNSREIQPLSKLQEAAE